MKYKAQLLIALSALLFACNNQEVETDATGVFEATEVIVSAEGNGKILSFTITEGETVKCGATLGYIDSTSLYFAKEKLLANRAVVQASTPDVSTQIEATKLEIVKQEREHARIIKLRAGDVATQKQLDDIEAAIEILNARLASQKSVLKNQTDAVRAQLRLIDVQLLEIQDQLDRCRIHSPIDGTILVNYAEFGELTAIGKPLFKVANMNQMTFKAYVTASQLSQIKLGQMVSVMSEVGASDNREYLGKITWISSKSEFTPKTIQTQDERANLVYAVKIAVENDGYLKIGMYGGLKMNDE